MDHELPPGQNEQVPKSEVLPELEQPSEAEIDRLADEFRDVERAEEESRWQEQKDSFGRMEKISDELAAQRAATATPEPVPSFQMPSAAQIKFDKTAQELSEEFDRRYAQARQSGGQIAKDLEAKGMMIPKTAAEVDKEEIAAISAHASEVHHPRVSKAKTLRRPPTRYRSPKDTGPPPHIAKEIRGENY